MSISNTVTNTHQLVSADKLDSDLLRTFLAIADTGSFTRGADRIFRSQSAISLQIKRLESVVGLPVFERHPRGIVLTPTGEKLRPVAQRVVDLLDATLGELRENGLEGSMRIGIPDEYGATILPGVIAAFTRDHPRVELVVHCGFSPHFLKALSRDEIDLAVHSIESPLRDATVLRTERTHWVSSARHFAHKQNPLPVALFNRDCWWRDSALASLNASGRPYRIVYTSESAVGIMAAITSGVAIGLVGESSLSTDLKILLPEEGLPEVPPSNLVMTCRDGINTSIATAMSTAIAQAFKTPSNNVT